MRPQARRPQLPIICGPERDVSNCLSARVPSKLATFRLFIHGSVNGYLTPLFIVSLHMQADSLRQQTLHQMRRILTTRQTARCFLSISEYHRRLRALSSVWASRPPTE